MIETEGVIIGEITAGEEINGTINVGKETYELQEKSTIPTTTAQEIVADQNYDGLSKVTVGAIPEEYIIPTGTLNITSNNTYDVKNYASAQVDVPQSAPNLQDKTVTPQSTNQTINADEGYDGLGTVTVEKIPDEYVVPSGTINITSNGVETNVKNYEKAKATMVNRIYYEPKFDNGSYGYGTENSEMNLDTMVFLGNTAYRMFYQCGRISKITFIPGSLSNENFSNITSTQNMFYYCTNLTTIKNLSAGDFSKLTNASQMFIYCPNLDDETLNDILLMCTKFTNSNYSSSNKKLSYLSIDSSLKNRIQNGSAEVFTNRQAFLDAGWSLN